MRQNENACPKLHQSVAHTMVSKSPLHVWWEVFGDQEQEPTDATDIGQIAHALILNHDTDKIAVLPFDDYRKKEAQTARDEARAAGKIPVKEKNMPPIVELVRCLSDWLDARGLNLTGTSEHEVEWIEEGDVACAGRIDHHMIVDHQFTILDFKFVDSAHPDALRNKVFQYGYDIQRAAYTSAVEHMIPELVGRVDFLFVFAEKDPPYAITGARLNGAMRALGNSRWLRAVEMWRHSLEKYGCSRWPSYDANIVALAPQEWAMRAEMECSEEFSRQMEGGIEVF